MRVDTRKHGDILVIEPHGDVDGKTAPVFQEQILALLQPQSRVVIDLADVPFMSSSGLRAMLLIYRQAKAGGVRIALANVAKEVINVMKATGFLSFFVVCDSVQAATEAVT